MALIRVVCSHCHEDIELKHTGIKVIEHIGGLTYGYVFNCYSCGAHCNKPADDAIVNTLLSVGVRLEFPEFQGPPADIDENFCNEFAKALKSVVTIDELFRV